MRCCPDTDIDPLNPLVHLTPTFLAKSNLLVIRSIWAHNVLNLLESSIFYAP